MSSFRLAGCIHSGLEPNDTDHVSVLIPMHSVADDTIISWTDSEAGTDIAISFQETAGCRHMWCDSPLPHHPCAEDSLALQAVPAAAQPFGDACFGSTGLKSKWSRPGHGANYQVWALKPPVFSH